MKRFKARCEAPATLKPNEVFLLKVWVQDLRPGGNTLYTPSAYDYQGKLIVGPTRKLARGVMACALRITFDGERSIFYEHDTVTAADFVFTPSYPNDRVFVDKTAGRLGRFELRAMQHIGEPHGSSEVLFAQIKMQAKLPTGWSSTRQSFTPGFLGLAETWDDHTFVAQNFVPNDPYEFDPLIKLDQASFVPCSVLIAP